MQIGDPLAERNLDGYGTPPIAWDRVRQVLGSQLPQTPGSGGPGRHTCWLTTTNADGSAHVVPLGVISHDGVWYFNSGPSTRKSQNLDRDSKCVLSVASGAFDLVLEGRAQRVTDAQQLSAVVERYRAEGWPATVEGEAFTAEFSAPSAGPPPWYLYRLVPSRVYAFGTAEPFGATRFDLVD